MQKDLLALISTKATELDLVNLVIGVIGCVLLSSILRWFFINFGRSISNRRVLGDTFLLLSVSVCLVIFLIKSSLALSLGLVGALSIVRFRAAIKEPEELVFLFFAIAIGLGFGADQKLATLTAFAIVLPIIYVRNILLKEKITEQGLFVNFRSSHSADSKDLMEYLKAHCQRIELKRVDSDSKGSSSTFLVFLKKSDQLMSMQEEIIKKFPEGHLSIINNSSPVNTF